MMKSALGFAPVSTLCRLAFRNVLRNWRHSLATVLAIAAGFTAVSLFDGFLRDLDTKNIDGYSRRGMLGEVVVMKKGALGEDLDDPWQYSLTRSDQDFLNDFLRHDPDFLRQVRYLAMTGMSHSGNHASYFMGFGFDVEEGAAARGDRWAWNTLAGVPLQNAGRPSVEIGAGLARLLGCMPPGPLPLTKSGNFIAEERPLVCKNPRVSLTVTTESAQVNLTDLPITSVIDAGSHEVDKRAIHMPLATAQRLLDTDKLTQVAVFLKNDQATTAFMRRLNRAARDKGIELETLHWWEHPMAAYARSGMQILRVFRNLFMTIVVTIGVMSIANTMMKAVNERFREIGTLRSIGFSRRDIVLVFGFEGMFTSLVACGLGLSITGLVAFTIGKLGVRFDAGFLSLPLVVNVAATPQLWVQSAILLSLLATGTALLCARKASTMVVADVLRHV